MSDKDLSSQAFVTPTAPIVERYFEEIATSDDGSYSSAQYTRLKQDVWYTKLLKHWLTQKYKDYDLSAIKMDVRDRDREYFDNISQIRQRLVFFLFGGDEDSNHELFKYNAIKIIAAHFGEESASLSFVQEDFGPYW